jgi:hypothetical protein
LIPALGFDQHFDVLSPCDSEFVDHYAPEPLIWVCRLDSERFVQLPIRNKLGCDQHLSQPEVLEWQSPDSVLDALFACTLVLQSGAIPAQQLAAVLEAFAVG